jgi:macrolide-specific efflux system membrane fusion protein
VTRSTAQTNIGYTRIVAPTDGTVVAIVTEESQTVNANQSAPTIENCQTAKYDHQGTSQ